MVMKIIRTAMVTRISRTIRIKRIARIIKISGLATIDMTNTVARNVMNMMHIRTARS